MDQVLEKLQTTVIDPDNDQRTLFDGLYKNWGKLCHQEQRRKRILDIQKRNRKTNLDATRGIMDLVSSVERANSQSDRRDRYRPSIHVAGFTRASLTYKNVLMMSEWLIERPEDFDSNWYVVPCPKGVRTLVVAYQGNTRFYTKHGVFRMACHTALPCGNPYDPHHKDQCVVLDCFHVKSLNKMFILDVLAWKYQPMTDGETEFRHYWMKNQVNEIPALRSVNSKNKMIFELLPKVPCDKDSLNEFMMKVPYFENNSPALDGLLFYHKKANYISGVTPLVGWLYPYMVNEVLGSEITVHLLYVESAPKDYVNQADFIQKFDAKHKRKKSSSVGNGDSMDTSSEVEQNQPEQMNHQPIDENTCTTNSETTESVVMDEGKDIPSAPENPDNPDNLRNTEMSTNDSSSAPVQSVDKPQT